ncbi:MAG TPA: helicase, partial [Gemmata sp.]|nr:helicase [Gemmata sp.]
MLLTLHEKGYVVLDPPPPPPGEPGVEGQESEKPKPLKVIDATPRLVIDATPRQNPSPQPPPRSGEGERTPTSLVGKRDGGIGTSAVNPLPVYQPATATPTPALDRLLVFRACHPLYGAYLVDLMANATREERIQLLESVLELPKPLLKFVRVPFDLPAGPLQTEKLDPELIAKGLMTAQQPKSEGEEDEEEEFIPWDERPPLLAEKARMLFDATHPEVMDFTTQAVWAAGEVLNYGNFNTFVTSKDLTKQEGLIFRHLLRLILLTEEFEQLTPPGVEAETWKAELKEIADRLTEICRAVDPTSTEETIKKAHAADVVEGEDHARPAIETIPEPPPPPGLTAEEEEAFGEGIGE